MLMRQAGTVLVCRMTRIGGRDISKVQHSDTVSWFVPGSWKCDNYIEPASLQASIAK